MKRILMRMALLAVLAGVGVAKADGDASKGDAGAVKYEFVFIVEITDLNKKVTREIKTLLEVTAMKKTMEAETRVFPKALEMAKKDWIAAEKNALQSAAQAKAGATPAPLPQMFPSGIVPRRLVEKCSFTDRFKAQKQMEQYDKLDLEDLAKAAKLLQKQSLNQSQAQIQKAANDKAKADAFDKAAAAVRAKMDELLKAESSPVAPAAAN